MLLPTCGPSLVVLMRQEEAAGRLIPVVGSDPDAGGGSAEDEPLIPAG
ncbi:MAG: hypothetical protein AAFN30_16670 [Actinomycetota bacterium]